MKKIFNILLLSSLFVFFSCYQPSPITGTWSDNRGDQITMLPDYTYTARITIEEGEPQLVKKGTYNVLLNAISFVSDDDGYQVVSEWDIRGNMLYLDWPTDTGKPLRLTLYKTKN